MTERVNLVDAYDNRSVIAKMVSMEERISGAETSVEASAEAAASSASAAAASQTAAKTSETNAKASADTAAATLANTVDLSSKQTVTGAKTFAGDTTVTGSFVTSGNAEMSKLDIDTGKLTVGSGGSAEINGPLTATNTANVIKAANHDSVLTSNDVLTAKDINEVNGKGNNLVHRTGGDTVTGFIECGYYLSRGRQVGYNNSKIYRCAYKIPSNIGTILKLSVIWGFNNSARYGMANVLIIGKGTLCKVDYHGTSNFGPENVIVAVGSDGYDYIFICNGGGYNGFTCEIDLCSKYGQTTDIGIVEYPNVILTSEPTTDDGTYTAILKGSAF